MDAFTTAHKVKQLVKPTDRDLSIIATGKANALAAAIGWRGGEHRFKAGKDGADIVLIKEILEGNLTERFETVIIASGDHAFAPFAEHLMKKGTRVVIISLETSLSRGLRELGCEIRFLRKDYALAT
jgi:uncharacterized LabA/DUF88 family protein